MLLLLVLSKSQFGTHDLNHFANVLRQRQFLIIAEFLQRVQPHKSKPGRI